MAFNPLWGQQLPVGVNASPYPALPQQPTPQMPDLPQQGGGMFGNGKFGIGQALVAALNGYLAGTGNPVGMQNMQMMAALRQRQQEHQQSLDDYNRKRADENADWQTHYDYKLHNPEPTDDQYTRALIDSGVLPGTPEYAKHMAARTNVLENPMVMTPYGPMPYSAVNPPAPTTPVGKLTPIDGGPAPGAPGGFPY